MAEISILRTELTGDPLTRGYAGMTPAQVTVDINTEYRTRNRTVMTGDEVFQNVASRADWDALTADEKTHFLSLCARQEIDPFAAANVELVKSIFGNGSATVTNLANARVESISRAVELGIGFVREGDVIAARVV